MKMKTRNFLFLAAISLVLFVSVHGSKILVSAPFGTKSHKNTYVQLVKELARRGHEITIITNSADSKENQHENIREIVIDELAMDGTSANKYPSFMKMVFSPNYREVLNFVFHGVVKQPTETTEKTFNHPKVRQLIQSNQTFDLILISQVCALTSYPLAWHFKGPMILLRFI